jgi:hypothetical protein
MSKEQGRGKVTVSGPVFNRKIIGNEGRGKKEEVSSHSLGIYFNSSGIIF